MQRRLDYNGKIVSARQASFPNGPDNVGTSRKFSFDNQDTYVLGLVVDSPASVNNFEYGAQLHHPPRDNDLGPVKGIADLHVHQFMNLAMGGRMYWGSPKVLNNCPGSANSFAQQVQYATDKGFAIAYGVDWNTGVSHLGPRFGKGRCWAASKDIAKAFRTTRPVGEPDDLPARAKSFKKIAGRNYYTDGLAHIGMLPELTVDLIDNLKTPGAVKLTQGTEAYLTMWERAYSTQP